MKKIFILLVLIIFYQCKNKKSIKVTVNKKKHQEIITKYVTNCAAKYNYRFDLDKWQNCLNEGLKIDSTVAYLWQQKAMPYFKARKYEVGMKFIDKAVLYNSEKWLDYRAFIKCIFAKTYKEAIKDFEKCIELYGNAYVMDHSYQFYIALSYLQLNEFKKAENILSIDIKNQENKWKEAHFLDLFYYGISKFEQGKFKEAIIQFDKALSQYKEFSDVNFYKANCLYKLGRYKEYEETYKKYKIDSEKGYTITEDNAIYESYPYQVKW